jgi:hypothetical protein
MILTKLRLFLLIALLGSGLWACNPPSNEEDLSTDLINNPVSADDDEGSKGLPTIQFKTSEHDFGKLIDGVKVAYKFKFTNTGDADLIISQVKTSCGCTVSKYPTEPIPKGESAYVELTFDSTNRKGYNNKTASVVSNAQPNVNLLTISAMVIAADEL